MSSIQQAKRLKGQDGSQHGTVHTEAAAVAAEQPNDADEVQEASSVCMAVSCYGQRLFAMEARDDASGPFRYQILQLAKLHAAPQVIYTSSKADPELLELLRSPVDPTAPAAQQFGVRVEKSSLFLPDKARAVLENVHVRGMPAGLSPRERVHLLNAMLTLSSEQQVCAAGALLAILSREGLLAGCSSDEDAVVFSVNGISELSLDGYLMVDPVSMSALQIFQEESHPSAMGIGQAKEGFSVFGLLNKCVSPMGKRLLRLWFARPIVNLAVLNDRLDAIEFFMQRPDAIKDALRKVKDAPRLLARLQSTPSMPDLKDFSLLQDSLANMLLLRDMLVHLIPEAEAAQAATRTSNPHPAAAASNMSIPALDRHGRRQMQQPSTAPGIMFKAASVIREELIMCHNLISSVIDFGREEEGMIVVSGVSEELDGMKVTYRAMPDYLSQLMDLELQRIPRELTHSLQAQHLGSIVYMPQVGFMLRLEGGRLRADLEEALPDYQLAFEVAGGEEGCGTYYNTARTRQLNARFGDMLHKIQDLEVTEWWGLALAQVSICAQLVQRLGEFAADIRHASEAVGELDCLLSLALAARELNLRRPQLTRGNELLIKEGRHLLTELLVDNFIPNDTTLLPDRDRIQVVTGPNFSGKSCYAKQVALIAFLAHVGSFVPAQEARVGLTDRIFTRLASRESAAAPQSTFMIDLSQVAAMLRMSTERSLCIIDEFGKGTLSADGIGLLCATLCHFASQPGCPKVLNPQYLPRSPQLAFFTMRVLVDATAKHGQQQQPPQWQPGAAGPQQQAGAGSGQQGTAIGGKTAADDADGQAVEPVNAGDLVFLYQLAPGHAAPSFGVYCAQLAGVKPEVVARAREVIAAQTSGAAIKADTAGRLEQRYGRYRGLVQQLLDLSTHDKAAAAGLLTQALAVAGQDG
ncbi:hypothetical protein N2152v2_005689 [Parachlorella kessleri]